LQQTCDTSRGAPDLTLPGRAHERKLAAWTNNVFCPGKRAGRLQTAAKTEPGPQRPGHASAPVSRCALRVFAFSSCLPHVVRQSAMLGRGPLGPATHGTEARACSCGALTTNHQKHLEERASKPVSTQVLQHNSVHTTEWTRKEDKVRGARGTRFFAPEYQKPASHPAPPSTMRPKAQTLAGQQAREGSGNAQQQCQYCVHHQGYQQLLLWIITPSSSSGVSLMNTSQNNATDCA
jgi:hypothetical protein